MRDGMTTGDRVAKLAEELGRPLSDWQRRIVDQAFQVDPTTGQFVYKGLKAGVCRGR